MSSPSTTSSPSWPSPDATRASFEPPKFRDDVRSLEDLKIGMELEGVVTNVTAFGAFVDVGVHQDGLVHVSKLSESSSKIASEVVKVGPDSRAGARGRFQRKRISLSARKDDAQDPRPVRKLRKLRRRASGPARGPELLEPQSPHPKQRPSAKTRDVCQ